MKAETQEIVRKTAIEDFWLLVEEGNCGYYNNLDIIVVFAHDKGQKRNFNLYTLITCQYIQTPQQDQVIFLTDKLIGLSKEYSIGIKQIKITDFQKIKDIFNNLLANQHIINGEKLEISPILLQTKQFVPYTEILNSKINAILQNYKNGSYILEFVDMDKKLIKQVFNISEVKALCNNPQLEQIKKLSGIDLAILPDKLGNVVLQFHSNLFEIDSRSQYPICFFDYVKEKPPLQIYRLEQKDKDKTIRNIAFQDNSHPYNSYGALSKGIITFQVLNPKNGLILHYDEIAHIKEVGINIGLGNSQYVRKFKLDDSEVEVPILATSYVRPVKQEKCSWETERRLKDSVDNLLKYKKLAIYNANLDNNDSHQQALEFLRSIINEYGKYEVCIIDPYLSGIDIKKTLFFNKSANSIMRAITGLRRADLREIDIANELGENKEELSIHLEVRQLKNINFHDRFLIVKDNQYNQPRAWSLGTSINGIGKSYHIIYEIEEYAGEIYYHFNTLWKKSENHVLWDSQMFRQYA